MRNLGRTQAERSCSLCWLVFALQWETLASQGNSWFGVWWFAIMPLWTLWCQNGQWISIALRSSQTSEVLSSLMTSADLLVRWLEWWASTTDFQQMTTDGRKDSKVKYYWMLGSPKNANMAWTRLPIGVVQLFILISLYVFSYFNSTIGRTAVPL